jgi:endonuclease III
MNTEKIPETLRLMEKQVRTFQEPIVTEISWSRKPYLVLTSCMLSLRTKDDTTRAASRRLFRVADTPDKMVKLSPSRLQKLIYPVGFYRNKAKAILETSRAIIGEYGGKVPDTLEGLLSLQGVGRKTANLVLGLGYGIAAICVDTHVHRISNRLGWVKTKEPHQTEESLQKIVPKKHWIDLNTTLVTFGQNICVPISPRCSICYVRNLCRRAGVGQSR